MTPPTNDKLARLLSQTGTQHGDSFDFNEELETIARKQKLAESYVKIDTGIGHLVTHHLISCQSRSKGKSAPAAPTPVPPITGLKAGQLIVATGWDRENLRGKQLVFGTFVEFSNQIVTLRTTAGKKRYLFNTNRYRWEVKPVRAFPTFALPWPKLITQ